jgi:hypothetical protein
MAKRWLVVVVVLLGVGGCGDDPEVEPAIVPVPAISVAPAVPSGSPGVAMATRTKGTKAAAAAERTGTGPDGFVAVVQREMPELIMDHRDEEIVGLAQQACDSLAAGRSAGAVVDEVRTYGTDRPAARRLVKLAIDTVCPDQDRRSGEF